jgi:hypothetical protein
MSLWDIPDLDVALCADRLVPPVTKWGTRRRTDPMPGTWHFYCNDYVFTHLIKWPGMVPATGCVVACEPNFSTEDVMPTYEIIRLTGLKRSIARMWQVAGIRILADLNVCEKAWEINWIGIPRGWTAYSVRAHMGVPFPVLHEVWSAAVAHAGTEEILFAVFGGGRKRIGNLCRHNGWTWVPEHRQVVQGLEKAYGFGT